MAEITRLFEDWSRMRVDLNADVGESFGAWVLGDDAGLMPSITSANIACGFHAGDASVMRRTVALAARHNVAVGAHPGFPDLQGFGRRDMRLRPAEVEDLVLYQIGALAGMAAAWGVRVAHVKPHGALYNMAARDDALADAVARAVRAFDAALVLVGLAGSALVDAGRRAGLRTASEVFADRGYRADGSLVPRGQPGAVLHDEQAIAARAVSMVKDATIVAVDGSRMRLDVETICVHGDSPRAAAIAAAVRQALGAAGVDVAAFSPRP